MKKPKIEAEEQQPRKIIRADKAPTDGYSLVVDGHFKSHHDTVEAAEEAGMALKNQYQMLQVQVYDAATKTRSMIEWPRQPRSFDCIAARSHVTRSAPDLIWHGEAVFASRTPANERIAIQGRISGAATAALLVRQPIRQCRALFS